MRSGLSQQILNDSKYSFLHDTSTSEMLAFVGMIYSRGLLGLANHTVDVLFNNTTGNPIFGATMSKNRFLLSHISFDDTATRPRRWLSDRSVAFREIFELFNENCARVMIPGAYLSLDETLYPMRSNIFFKQFNPSKPANYCMLFDPSILVPILTPFLRLFMQVDREITFHNQTCVGFTFVELKKL